MNTSNKEHNVKEWHNYIDALIENGEYLIVDRDNPEKRLSECSIVGWLDEVLNEMPKDDFIYDEDDFEEKNTWEALGLEDDNSFLYYVQKYADYFNLDYDIDRRNFTDYIVRLKDYNQLRKAVYSLYRKEEKIDYEGKRIESSINDGDWCLSIEDEQYCCEDYDTLEEFFKDIYVNHFAED